MIRANTFLIDDLTSNISNYIQTELNNNKTSKVKLSIGSFTGTKIFSGIGPYVDIKIASTGKVNTDLRSEFIAQGINQTIHRIYLQIYCNVNILTPFNTLEEEISNQVLIGENVILGHIPETYYNLEGMKDLNDTLEAIK